MAEHANEACTNHTLVLTQANGTEAEGLALVEKDLLIS